MSDMNDPNVNHPAHYGGADDVYEVIKVCEAWGLDNDAYLFQAIKYVARAGKKIDPGMTVDEMKLRDYSKALFYLDRRLARRSLWQRLSKSLQALGLTDSRSVCLHGSYAPREVAVAWGFTPGGDLDLFVEDVATGNVAAAKRALEHEMRWINKGAGQ